MQNIDFNLLHLKRKNLSSDKIPFFLVPHRIAPPYPTCFYPQPRKAGLPRKNPPSAAGPALRRCVKSPLARSSFAFRRQLKNASCSPEIGADAFFLSNGRFYPFAGGRAFLCKICPGPFSLFPCVHSASAPVCAPGALFQAFFPGKKLRSSSVSSGTAGLYRYPWKTLQPSSSRVSRISCVSTHSAIT